MMVVVSVKIFVVPQCLIQDMVCSFYVNCSPHKLRINQVSDYIRIICFVGLKVFRLNPYLVIGWVGALKKQASGVFCICIRAFPIAQICLNSHKILKSRITVFSCCSVLTCINCFLLYLIIYCHRFWSKTCI